MGLREKCKLYEFKERGDERGKLIAIEALKDIPFEIKRVFYIFNTASETVRGQHANKKSDFLIICLKGSCKIKVYDDYEEYVVNLNKPNLGLFIPRMVWKDMYDFSGDAVLLSLSNEYYDENEYLRDAHK